MVALNVVQVLSSSGSPHIIAITQWLLHLPADVIKALCLGARAVGLGRAFLYAQSVRHCYDITVLCAVH